MRGNARKGKLNYRAGRKRENSFEPRTAFDVVLMIFPEQGHQQVDVKQASHSVWLSIS